MSFLMQSRLSVVCSISCSRDRHIRGADTVWILLLLLGFGAISPSLLAQSASLTVAWDKPGHAISPTLYGIFFEDINCSAEGGAVRGVGSQPKLRRFRYS